MTTLHLYLDDYSKDFAFIADNYLKLEHNLFWVAWVIMVIFSALIFLNFIIAEVSASYEKCKIKSDALIYKARAILINEAEDIMSKARRADKTKFPKYIILREMEE